MELLSDNSPLLIFQNEKSDRSKSLDLKSMQGRFSNIKGCYEGNLSNCRGLPELRNAINHHIQQLPHIGETLPKQWVIIRQRLEELAEQKDFIGIDEYLIICENNKLSEHDRALQLSRFLHDLGTFLHFQEDPLLQELFILNNKWATDAVYQVLDNETVKKNRGLFTRNDLKIIWSDSRYQRKHSQLLALMVKFEICYPFSDAQYDTWLAPQLLSAVAPKYRWNKSDNLIVRYVYDFMPKGLLSRFIVRMNRYITDNLLIWRSGVVLQRQHSQAEITETYGGSEIVIRTVGSFRKELMTLIAEEFDRIHVTYGERLKLKKLIPCNCRHCLSQKEPHFYKYDDLIRRKEKGKRTIECEMSYDDVDVVGLLDGVFTKVLAADGLSTGRTVLMPRKVFLSYSHEDEKLKQQLDKHLYALKQNNIIKTWNDREIPYGEEWDDEIKSEIADADIVLLLVSADFIASKYIREIEIKKAMERHQLKKSRVIPIFLRPCDWEGLPFSKLQGLPKNAKSVTSFDNQDIAFEEIAKGIRQLLISENS